MECSSISAYFRTKTTHLLGEKIISTIRSELFAHIMGLGMPHLEQLKLGDLLVKIDSDCNQIKSFISKSAAVSIRTILQIIVGIIILLLMSYKLTLFLCGIIPLIILPIGFVGKKVKNSNKDASDAFGKVLSFAEERINYLSILKSLNAQQSSLSTFENLLENRAKIVRQLIHYRSLLIAIVISIVFLTIAIMVWLGTMEVTEHNITVGHLVSFIFYAIIIAGSINNIAEIVTEYSSALGAVNRLKDLLGIPVEKSNVQNNKANLKMPTSISFDKVSFAYPGRPENIILNNLSFSINSGDKVAIVGQSGVGKSSILKLLLGYYSINSGIIKINKHHFSTYSLKQIRNIFAFVPQESVIFNASIRDNITIGMQTEVTDTIINSIGNKSLVADFVNNFSKGYNTMVGEKGVQLSGGKKQRISIARAILKGSQCFLLDEATNSLDSKNEEKIRILLDNVLHDKTAIIIAHRLSTVKNVDKIIVLSENGTIDSEGTHNELMQNSALYKSLAKNQLI